MVLGNEGLCILIQDGVVEVQILEALGCNFEEHHGHAKQAPLAYGHGEARLNAQKIWSGTHALQEQEQGRGSKLR